MANVTIRTCDRCGKGVHADAKRVSLSSELVGMVDEHVSSDDDADDNGHIVAMSVDLCDRCIVSLCTWAKEIKRRAAAKEGTGT